MLGAIALGVMLVVIGVLMVLPLALRTIKRAAGFVDSPTMVTVASLQIQTQRITTTAGAIPRLAARANAVFKKPE